MREDMVEKVARRLAIADGKDPDAPAFARFPGGNPEGLCWRDEYTRPARAAIEAMREPNEAMVDAAFHGHGAPHEEGRKNTRETFSRMIDAALL